MEVEPAIRPMVNIDTRMDGSINDEIMASRLEPMPPKVLPVSRAERHMKNLPKASK